MPGLPFVRSVMAEQVRKELSFFLYLSAIVTGVIMLLFFRSVRAVIFSMIMIGIVVVWTIGTIALFGFKISLTQRVDSSCNCNHWYYQCHLPAQ
jgi:predicted RND superfamily exporter protein